MIKNFFFLFVIGMLSCNSSETNSGSFIDKRDNQEYKWVKIGKQVWMAENLRYKSDSSYVYDNDEEYVKTFGRLYDWESACEVCPDGWHLPSKNEWEELSEFLGGNEISGGKLKMQGTEICEYNNVRATNEYNFSGLAGGCRGVEGVFSEMNLVGYYWTTTSQGENWAWNPRLNCQNEKLEFHHFNKKFCFSIRCVKDNE